MKIGFIGLGKMGQEMVLHLVEEGVEVVAWNRSMSKIENLKWKMENSGKIIRSQELKELSAKIENLKFLPAQAGKNQNSGRLYKSKSIEELVQQLERPRIVWLMVEQGGAVDEVIEKLLNGRLEMGDVIIDGGNSFYKDSIRRYNELAKHGIHFMDVGTSGGLEGARYGACLMIGGDKEIYERLVPLFEKIATSGGFAYFGPTGAGHFVKMIHNGVEYGLLQAIGEGFEILKRGPYDLDLTKVAGNWNHGSVVRGWLVELLLRALKKDVKLEEIEGVIGGGRTGEWALETAKESGVETPVLEKSLEARKKSQKKPTFAGKVVAALRREFGGHETINNKQ